MEFFIRKGATAPILKMNLIDDGRNDRSSINDLLESSSIFFNMYDVKSGKEVVLNGRCLLSNRRERLNQNLKEYSITYTFTEEETSVPGRYEGVFTIEFLDTDLNVTSKLIVPIREKLFVNVI